MSTCQPSRKRYGNFCTLQWWAAMPFRASERNGEHAALHRSAFLASALALTACQPTPFDRMAAMRAAYLDREDTARLAETRELAEHDAAANDLRARLFADMANRSAAQGRVRKLSDDGCSRVILAIPQEAIVQGPLWRAGEPSQDSPYLTGQENACLAQSRAHAIPGEPIYPGLLPDGWRAVYLGNGRWRLTPR